MLGNAGLARFVVGSVLLGLRIAPFFGFAPPFTLVRVPRLVRLLTGLGLAVCLVAANPNFSALDDFSLAAIVMAGARELALGLLFVTVFQVSFAGLYLAGRVLDIQAGYGLAVVIDPTTRSQTPLIGTLFALGAGAMFFGLDGHLNVLRLFSASLRAIPLGGWTIPDFVPRLAEFMSVAFLMAFGAAGLAALALFLVDVVIALMSRTIPQMNVLVLGVQVKSLVLLLVLPLSLGASGALFARLMAMTLAAIPGLT